MKTHAGDIVLDLPGNWDDDSNYVYRKVADDIEVTVEYAPAQPGATPDMLLDDIEARLKKLPGVTTMVRSDGATLHWQGRVLSIGVRGDAEDDSMIEVLVFKLAPTRSVVITATAPARQATKLAAAWKHILGSLLPTTLP
ncbi:MAG: hypothetical protein ACOYN0_02765 [Phycisphaerales bacterium]